MLITNMSTK